MKYSLKQAADAVGKSKATIHRDVKKGKISASKDDSGRYKIDPSELFRVYPKASDETSQDVSSDTLRDGKNVSDNSALQQVLEAKDEQLALKDDLIEQIKTERDRVYGLLTDQSNKQGEKETQLQEEIEALKAKVQAAERAELEKDFEVRGLKQKTAELEKSQVELDAKAKGYARKAQQLKEEAEKPWYKKLFG